MEAFIETEERNEIVEILTQATELLAKGADLLNKAGYPNRGDKISDAAQIAISVRSLISLDWKEEDAKEEAA